MDTPLTTITDVSNSEDEQWCVDIATRIGAGDRGAEASLVSKLRPGILMLLRARCAHDPAFAADICQETLVIVLQRLRAGTIQDPKRLAGFAAQTARQLEFDARRRNAVRKTVVDTDAVLSAVGGALPGDSVDQTQIAELVRDLLTELSHDRDREVLRRFYLHDDDKAEICRSLGLAPGAFDQVVFRARARLKSMLVARGLGARDFLCVLLLWMPASWRR